jgi:hypothetical protein
MQNLFNLFHEMNVLGPLSNCFPNSMHTFIILTYSYSLSGGENLLRIFIIETF